VTAVLLNLESAPIPEPLRATLRILGKLTSKQTIDAHDMRTVLAAGASAEQIKDALAVGFAFNTADRLASAFGFEVLSPKASMPARRICSAAASANSMASAAIPRN
jgi:alkylhydroperoxidase family enzyme